MSTIKAIACAVALGVSAAAAGQEHEHVATVGGELGRVEFATSCTATAQPHFNRGVALLHSFEFGRAVAGFNAALAADPSCTIAEWGVALSAWGNPFAAGIRPAAALTQGSAAVALARTRAPKSERERAYIDAVSRLYDRAETIDQLTRLTAYRDAMAVMAAAYRGDSEASIFHALAI